MKRIISLLSGGIAFIGITQAQPVTKGIPDAIAGKETIEVTKKNDKSKTEYLNHEIFKKRVLRDFSSLAIGQSNTSTFTNYLSVSVLEAKVQAAGAIGFDKGGRYFLTTAIAASTLDKKTAELFSGFKINSNVSLDLKFHIRPWGLTKYYYTARQKNSLDATLAEIEGRKDVALFEFDNREDGLKRDLQIKKDSLSILENGLILLDIEINKKKGELDAEKDSLKKPKLAIEYNNLLVKKGQHERMQQISKTDSLAIEKALAALQVKKTEFRTNIEKKFSDEDEEAQLSAPWNGFNMFWITFRYNPFSNSYYVFDTSQVSVAPKFQTRKEKFGSYQVGGELNYYQWRATGKKTFYTNLGIVYKRNNNITDLETIDIEDKYTQADLSNSLGRTFISKYKAYDLDSITQANEVYTYYNIYYFLGAKGAFAPHVNLSYRVVESDPQFDFQLGLLLEVKDKASEKSTVNIEAFIGFTDAFNQRKKENKLKDRTLIGLRFNFPLVPSIISKKKT